MRQSEEEFLLRTLIPNVQHIFMTRERTAHTLVERKGVLYKVTVEEMLPEFQRIYGDMKAGLR
jgi:hypothetical protein